MKFEKVEEIKAVLDKTTTIEYRPRTGLLLLNGKFAELKDLIKPLQELGTIKCAERIL